jgi:aminopeptidase N
MARLDPHSHVDSDHPQVDHLDLRLRVDFPTSTLAGTAALRLAMPARGGPLDLDTRDLQVESVTDDKGTPVPFRLGPPQPILGAPLRLDLPAGVRTVTVRYRTSPAATALQWLNAAQTAGKAHPYLFSQCQPTHARSLAPLPDSPRVRLRFHAELTVPEDLTAVMAASPGGRLPCAEPGRVTYAFDMPQPIPTYLLALAVGNIAAQDLSTRTRVYAEPEVLEAAAHEFANVEQMVRAAEALFGPYPWERFDILVMPPSFPYGGMENPRLTFLTPTLLAGDRSLVNVLVHELAHSWTGNLVTNASMEHFWLNEGFTVYAERRILERLEGPEAVALHAAIGRSALEDDLGRMGWDSPLTALRNNLQGVDPDEVFSQVPYEKGCLFLQRVEQEVGRQAFDRFLALYLAHFAFKSITTEDFLAFADQKLDGALRRVGAARWLDQPGLPEDAPRARSQRLSEIESLTAKWTAGTRPSLDELRLCSVRDWQVLLPRLPKLLPVEDCRWLDEQFSLSSGGNAEVRVAFLALAARSGYRGADAVIRRTLLTVGRMKYLRPLYVGLCSRPETVAMAREVFAAAREGYHPVARNVIEGVLKSAAGPAA